MRADDNGACAGRACDWANTRTPPCPQDDGAYCDACFVNKLEAACKRKDNLLGALADAGDNCAVSQADVESAREEVGKR